MIPSTQSLAKDLLANLRHNPHQPNRAQVQKAVNFAEEAHQNQKRKSGEPYVNHPLHTAIILNNWHQDEASILAGLLHDVLEDTSCSRDALQQEFGREVTALVVGVTKISAIDFRGNKEDEFAANLKQMFLAMSKDPRVVIIKLADRLHNMATVLFLPPKQRARFCQETSRVYAPLAYKLGMSKIRGDLLDYCLEAEHPKRLAWIREYAQDEIQRREKLLEGIKVKVKRAFAKAPLELTAVDIRRKHWHSLYEKLHRPAIDKNLSEVYDLVILRLAVPTTRDCYTALGLVHQLLKPIPHIGLSDFIAQPKPNGYEALHTRVFGPGGLIFEIQIREAKMHRRADLGIAADLQEPESKRSKSDEFKKKLYWTKKLIEWQESFARDFDGNRFLNQLEKEILKPTVYILDQTGRIVEVPEKCTLADYLATLGRGEAEFQIKINNRAANPKRQLASGDVVSLTPR